MLNYNAGHHCLSFTCLVGYNWSNIEPNKLSLTMKKIEYN